MQSLEAIISLLVFLSMVGSVLTADPGPSPLDDSLYRIQLSGDVWRVLYLRGDLREMDRGRIESDMRTIGDQTGLCVFMSGVEYTNCRDGRPHEGTVSISKTVLYRKGPLAEAEPMTVTFTVSR